MGSLKIRYYTTRPRKEGRAGYWQPTRAMREAGFVLVPCGPDGPEAWKIAEEWNKRWDEYRTGAPVFRYPHGSLGAAFAELRETGIWSAKKLRTREDWERGWRYIEPVFADVAPVQIKARALDQWYRQVLTDKGVREAHRAMKIWRALWQQAAAFGYCDSGKDPSAGIRRQTPQPRQAVWSEGEIVRVAKSAWRRGYHGLACIIAVAWETAFSPVDVRRLTFSQMDASGARIVFRVARAKTGRAAMGRLGKRADALVRAYVASLPGESLAAAPIFRHRHGMPYSKDTLGDDFRDVREDKETRTLADIRRSAAVEAQAGGASDQIIAQKLANDVGSNEALRQAYLPVNEAAVRAVDDARRIGRQNIRNTKV